ncbi:hypothetical protein AAG570_011488 [Ranatra chinensis]|uniref:Cwf19-like protein C-terminal domain-containing protein n=1 Tax=Ranatra chinensis TaxID=642074 RepID=A0ABD0YX01_9HEMI
MDMKRALVKFYEDRDEDVVFFESVSNFKYHPHMVINSVPIAKEVGDIAPIYFKKAIQECEMEWSNNKKLVELAGKGVRRAIPKGLPYFSVDFGLQDGFAHIIEDHKLFPNNFAQEIIGGMLDLDHSLWRKPRRENPELLREKASKFSESFKKYNPTKQE